jgi:acyl carrier protein
MIMEELSNALRRALISRFGVRQAVENDTALFSTGLIDSLNVIELVCFVEEQLGRAVPPAEITLENFDSIDRIMRFASKLDAIGQGR